MEENAEQIVQALQVIRIVQSKYLDRLQKPYDYTNTNTKERSLKLVQKLGRSFLRARVASWRYQRGSRSLAVTLAPGEEQAKEKQGGEKEEYYEVPDTIE